MELRDLALPIFFVSMLFFGLSFESYYTGNVISEHFFPTSSIFQIIGLVFLIGSFLLLNMGKSLDLLIIPTGGDIENKKRIDKAIKEWNKRYVEKLMISGELDNPLKDSQRYSIYKELRKEGIKPSNLYVSGGKDSKGNLEKTFEKLKDLNFSPEEIGIVSYPSHLDRFESYFENLKEEGKIPEGLRLKRIKTKQSIKNFAYGHLAKIKDKYNFNKLNKGFTGKILKRIFG